MLAAGQQNQLLELLVQRGLLKGDQVDHVRGRAQKEGQAVEAIIRTENLIYPEVLAQVIAEVLGVPYVDLQKTKVADEALADVSRKAITTYRFIPFSIRGKSLLVAMDSPHDFQAQEAVKFIARRKGLKPEIYLASSDAIDKALGGGAAARVEIGGALAEFSKELEAVGSATKGKESKEIETVTEEAPVTKVVAVIIRHAIEGKASDIHIEPSEKGLRVRYRIDGALHTTLTLPIKVQAAIVSRIKILSNLKIDEQRLPQDGRFSVTVDGKAYDFRVSVMPTTFGEKVAMRILDKTSSAPSFDDLGLTGPMQKTFLKYLGSPHGIILISGPTGAGKSTTLFSALNGLNAPDVNIVTLEDPVEYEIPGINQTQTHPSIGLTFASGLRSILRQDPDIIMVGEIRDKETAELAVHSSLTGHLVLSTIHTNDAVGAIPRLVDMGIDPFLLAASLRLVAAQRLVSKICQNCKKEVKLSTSLRDEIIQTLEGLPDQYFTTENQRDPKVLYEAGGCPECRETGVVGRMAIFEVVPLTRAMRGSMNEHADYDTLTAVARKDGSATMRQDGILKALAGEVLYEDVIRATAETEDESL